MLHIDQSFKCKYSPSLTLISSSALICSNLCSSFYNTFRMGEFEFSPLAPFACHSNVIFMPCEWLNVK